MEKSINDNKDLGIYIHIPFCKSKCFYCDFVSFPDKDTLIQEYIDSLCKEILNNSEILFEYNIATIYFGGGTPSYINSKFITKIMDTLKLFNVKDGAEITIEINPGTINKDKITDYITSGINRFSIGLQSTYDDVLKSIGRSHTYDDFVSTLESLNQLGAKNISLDLMYPLPGLNLTRFNESLDHIILLTQKYSIQHISIYNLEVHEGSKLDFLLKQGFLSLPTEDEEYEMAMAITNKLESVKFVRYEISNYAKEGYESKHNTSYWRQKQYLGFGVNASSFFLGTRYTNTSKIPEYIKNISSGCSNISESISLDKLELMKEYIILNLRLKEGIHVMEFKSKFEMDIFSLFKIELDSLINTNLLIFDDKLGKIYLSERGKEIANQVWLKFI